MKRHHAAAAAVVGLALTTSAVLAGTAVSTLARDHAAVGGKNHNHGGAVSTLARGTHGTPANTTHAGAQGAHGAAVSAVAKDKTQVGGPNNNPGGAVSLIPRHNHGKAPKH